MTDFVEVKAGFLGREGTLDAYVIGERNAYLKLEPTQDDILLDVGANIGAVACTFASKVKQVIAIEPEPSNLEVLRANIEHFHADNVTVIAGAATLTRETRNFYLNTGTNKGAHSLLTKRGRDVIEVECYPFAEILETYKPTLLKMDIEGGEYELAPILANLPSSIRGIAIELHLNRKDWRGTLAPAIIESITVQGFNAVRSLKIGEKNWCTMGVYSR